MAVTAIVNHVEVSFQCRQCVERLSTFVVIAGVNLLTINAERFAMFLSLVSNEVILAAKCLVAVFILAPEVLHGTVSRPATNYRSHYVLTASHIILLQDEHKTTRLTCRQDT